jgi:hypothetical protein
MRFDASFVRCQKKLAELYSDIHSTNLVLFEDFAPCTPIITFTQTRFREAWNLRSAAAKDPTYYMATISHAMEIAKKAYLFRIDPKVRVSLDVCRRIEGQIQGTRPESGVDGTDQLKSLPMESFPFAE